MVVDRPGRARPDRRRVGPRAASTCRSRSSTRPTARSSGRSSTTPRRSARRSPRGVVAVFIPEYVVGRWWEQLLHNQTALRLKTRLLFTPGVMMTSVPYQLRPRGSARSGRCARTSRSEAGRTLTATGPSDIDEEEPVEQAPGDAQTRDPRAVGGRRRRYDVEVGAGRARRRTASRGSPPTCPRSAASSSSCGTRCPASGSRSRSPRARSATGSCAATRSRSTTRRRTGWCRPARYAGPGRCGGCDFQHVDLAAQRRLKARVVEEQLRRLAGIDRDVEVEPVPGDDDGLRWRTRMRFHRLPRRKRSGCAPTARASWSAVDDCLIQAPDAG